MSKIIRPLKVYYLDDETDLLDVFIESFQSEEVVIEGFTDPNAFLRKILADSPDLVFIDYRLRHTNGDLVGLEIEKSVGASLKKYVITGELKLTTNARFEGIVYKPFKPDKIQEILNSAARESV